MISQSSTDKVRSFVVDNFLFGDGAGLEESTSFMEKGIIDSTGMLELISFIEQAFDVHIKDDDLIPENLDSLNNVGRFVERLTSV